MGTLGSAEGGGLGGGGLVEGRLAVQLDMVDDADDEGLDGCLGVAKQLATAAAVLLKNDRTLLPLPRSK